MADPDIPWFDGIRDKRRVLTVFAGRSVTGSAVWTRVLARAITEFNNLSRNLTLNVGVTLAGQNDQPEADADHFGGADIWLEAKDQFKFAISGQTPDINLAADPFVRGHTQKLAWDFGKGARVRKACILMRPDPQSDDFPRRVGDGVLMCWTVHEFIHAIGLSEHTRGAGDLFEANPTLRSGTRNDPETDRLEVRGGTRIPPITPLTGDTIGRVQKLWPKP
jgi:hypothetical protein